MTSIDRGINDIAVTPARVFIAGSDGVTVLSRTTRWGCLPRERDCDDAVDDDCDGRIDRRDTDCAP